MAKCFEDIVEARVMGHFTYPYDDGDFSRLLLEGDIHSYTAKGTFPRQLEKFDIYADDFDKDNPEFKPWRNKAKAILYACIYGASAPKIAKMVGVTVKEGEEIFKRFWETNWALSQLRTNLLDHWKRNKKKFIINPISGARIAVTKEHTVLNYLFQNTGSFVMDVANHYMASWLGEFFFDELDRPYQILDGQVVKRVIYYH